MKKIPWLLGLVLFVISATGCEWPFNFINNESKRHYREIILPDQEPPDHNINNGEEVRVGMLYYPDPGKKFLVPVTRRFPYTDTIARATLEYLIAGPEREKELEFWGLSASIPLYTEIRGISIGDNVARVDFSASFLSYPPEEERLILNSILCTLKQFPNIDQVLIMVEGVALDQLPGGTPGKLPLGPECRINLEVSEGLEDYREYTAVKIFFAYLAPGEKIFYVPVTRVLSPRDDPVKASLLELLKGPRRGSGLFSDIPPETKVLALHVEDNVVIVDFSREILYYGGGLTGEQNVISQVVLTLTEYPEVEKVKILIEGKERILPEGTDLSLPLSRSLPLNLL